MTADEVLGFIREKRRITIPKKYECPEAIYQLMKECWHENPNKRPNFTNIKKFMENQLVELENQYEEQKNVIYARVCDM